MVGAAISDAAYPVAPVSPLYLLTGPRTWHCSVRVTPQSPAPVAGAFSLWRTICCLGGAGESGYQRQGDASVAHFDHACYRPERG